jgi:hypothetical protein
MESQFESVGITNAVRFSAFTGPLRDADPGFKEELLDLTGFNEVRENTFKAIASHLWAIASLDFKDSPYALVLEDDVILTTSLNWGFTLNDFCNALPNGWDAVQLYLNPNWSPRPRDGGVEVTVDLRSYSSRYISTLAYLITKERAQQIKQEWFRSGVPDLSKAYTTPSVSLTDHVVYTERSYGTNLFSTQEFVSTIVKEVPERFHKHSREVTCIWENQKLSLSDVIGFSYSEK